MVCRDIVLGCREGIKRFVVVSGDGGCASWSFCSSCRMYISRSRSSSSRFSTTLWTNLSSASSDCGDLNAIFCTAGRLCRDPEVDNLSELCPPQEVRGEIADDCADDNSCDSD
jgi:hypothetical protein